MSEELEERSYRPLLADAARRAVDYLEALGERSVLPRQEAVCQLSRLLTLPMPELGSPAAQVLAELDSLASPATVASAGPRFFGFVTGGALPITVASSWLASAWDQNAFKAAASPAGVLLEAVALNWLKDTLGLRGYAGAAVVTGATMASFTALAAARSFMLRKQGWDVEAEGLRGAPPLYIVTSEETHSTVFKALGMLGLGRNPDLVLPTDAQGRVRATSLPPLPGPAIVCAQVGNVNSGASDPLPALRAHCDAHGAWLHVDGAFGLWAAASPRLRAQVDGIEHADSCATDAHKWLNVPYDCGIAFVRDALALQQSMSIAAPYFPSAEGREPFDFTPDSSRRARGVDLWAALRSLGKEGVRALVERCCDLAQRFADGLRAAGHEVLNEVVLNQVLVSFGDAARCEQVAARVQQEGVCWVGTTRFKGRPAIRISVSCWATTVADIDRSLVSLLDAERAVTSGQSG